MKDNLKDIGILGRRHYDYLKANKPTVINVIRMNGTLNDYLKRVNDEAEEMLYQLVRGAYNLQKPRAVNSVASGKLY